MNKKNKVTRYKNEKFLKALGKQCQELRVQKGYTIDKMYREGEQLSTSVIHRLENGTSDTQISVFYRYAQVLGIELQELFQFNLQEQLSDKIIPVEDGERPKYSVPYYDIKVAAGLFENEQVNEETPSGWVLINNHKNLNHCFATHIVGKSMEPTIPSGSLCLFRFYQGGSRQNRTFLIKARGVLDPETQESFVIKKYKRITQVKDNEHRGQVIVHLLSENKAYPPIVLMSSDEKQIEIVAELIDIIE